MLTISKPVKVKHTYIPYTYRYIGTYTSHITRIETQRTIAENITNRETQTDTQTHLHSHTEREKIGEREREREREKREDG